MLIHNELHVTGIIMTILEGCSISVLMNNMVCNCTMDEGIRTDLPPPSLKLIAVGQSLNDYNRINRCNQGPSLKTSQW